eukprot:scaffold3795_cov126-Isochrysis_galbana.AAC.13
MGAPRGRPGSWRRSAARLRAENFDIMLCKDACFVQGDATIESRLSSELRGEGRAGTAGESEMSCWGRKMDRCRRPVG